MKYIIIHLILIVFTVQPILSQDMIDEDFLDIISKNAQPLWSQTAAQFSSNIVPEKYKNESGVIFGYKRELTIDKKSKTGFLTKGERSLIFYENIRFKVKLNDRNAVKSFTEFYFRYSDKEDGFSAKVTKKDGLSTNVSLSNAVKIENVSEVPEFFKSFFDQEIYARNRYYKVAIPDLEPGDILEYVSITKSKLDVRKNGFVEFSPQYEVFSKKYPILFNQIAIETDNKSFFKAMSKNGAPEFKKEASQNAEFFRFVLTDNDRPTNKDVSFINAYKQLPFVKFQVIYANSDNVKGALLGTRGEIKSKFTKEELAFKAWEDYKQTGDYLLSNIKVDEYVTALYKDLKKQGAKDWTDKQYIKNIYYRLRNFVLYRDSYLSDQYAIYLFRALLFQRDIPSELVISVSNNIGEVGDILFEDEIRYLAKVGNDYYFNMTDYSNPGDLVETLLNSEAYIVGEANKKTGEQSIQQIKLPDATFNENKSNFILDVSLNNDLNSLTISRTSNYIGINKSRNIKDALRNTPYMLDDYKNYDGDPPTDKMNAKQEEMYDEQVRNLKKEMKEAKPEFVKSELQKEFGKKVIYKDFVLTSDGRSLKKPELIFTESFELQNMVRKAGKKLLINLVGLVGSQLQFKKEERIRQYDVDVDYARHLNWTIQFKVPAGYTIEGLPELNNTVDNEIGTYKCTATLNGEVAKIEISKIYKKATFSKTKWNDMLSFVDAAYNNSFKNILLKPKN